MEPIAIVGIGCRFPGANNPEAFWQLLRDGREAITEVPPDRWDVDRFYHPEPAQPGKMNTRYGGFLEQVDQFDPEFYGISPREAERIDPQQRLVLEVAWEALENAGIVPTDLSGTQSGVFIGIGNYDFGILLSQDLAGINAYDGTGNTLGVAANRLSYLLNLRGPSLALETACSSSLVALHLACQSLRNQESDLCIVGAVSLMLSPAQTITYSQARMMAADGRCKTFDAAADGYVRGEGCGIVVLKRLTDALRDGDRIQALIRGSAVNQDGLSNGLTAPNGPSQQAVIRQALQNASVAPSQISYVEAHGTGTSLGDPIEVKSLKTVLMQGRQPDQSIWLGSVKTNVGHLEAAAGMAGLIKVILALQHQEIPPHLNFQQLNPLISFAGTPFAIPTQLQPWTVPTGERFAGVSSFGFGGTNAHVILQEAPVAALTPRAVERPTQLLSLSAKTDAALRALAQRYHEYLLNSTPVPLADVCFTANVGRSHFDHRLAVVFNSSEQLRSQLAQFITTGKASGIVSRQITTRKRPRVAFLFTGQGSQYAGMAQQLYETQPTFRAVLEDCAAGLRPYLNQPLLQVLFSPDRAELLDQTVYTQTALFAVEYALSQLWQSWGIQPDAVLGHSVGEYVAACVAGVFSLADGLKLIGERARLMQALPGNGAMLAVMANVNRISQFLAGNNAVAIAAYNSSESVVLSGAAEAIAALSQTLQAAGIKSKQLVVSHAFHSPLMQPLLAEFEQVANTVNYASPQVPFISNVIGGFVTTEVTQAQYWCDHIVQPVRFAEGMQTAAAKCSIMLEIGPKPTLLGLGQQSVALSTAVSLWLPSLRPGQSDWQVMLHSLAELYGKGVAVDWQNFDRDYVRQRVGLPTYPFQRQRYWVNVKDSITIPGQTVNLPVNPSVNAIANPIQNPVLTLLEQAETTHLTQLFSQSGRFSAEQQQYLPELVDLLVQQYQQQQQVASIQDWLYEIIWQAKPRQIGSTNGSTVSARKWLIFADTQGAGQALARLLRQQGDVCYLVYMGQSYQSRQDGSWSIDPSRPTDFQRLLQEINAADALPLQQIIHLWSLASPIASELSIATLEEMQLVSCGSVLHLMQALLNFNGTAPVAKIWLMTREAIAVNDASLGLAQSSLWGLGKVMALEHPEWFGGMIDLSAEPLDENIAALAAELLDAQGEDFLAFRNGQRYAARLTPVQRQQAEMNALYAASVTSPAILSDGTYLITGGLGMIGLKVAEWLVQQGTQNLVLVGRSQPSPKAQQAIEQLQLQGVSVRIAQADVTQLKQMSHLFDQIKAGMPPLRGVFHAAGSPGYEPLQQISWSTWETVLRPKVIGTWLLHQLTQEMELDFFVVFSSISSVWGSKGQAHYAAGNAFLDSFAHYRTSSGKRTLSVNWGPWAGGGMTSDEAQALLKRIGVGVVPPERGIAALGYVLQTSAVQITVADVNWPIFRGLYEARGKRSLLELLESSVIDQHRSDQSNLKQRLQAVSQQEAAAILVAYLQAEVGQVLGYNHLPEVDRGFFEMGMDSLMAIDLKARLERDLAVSLPPTIAFESPTIAALAEYLGHEYLGWQSEVPLEHSVIQRAAEREAALSMVEQLADDDLNASIAQELAELELLLQRN